MEGEQLDFHVFSTDDDDDDVGDTEEDKKGGETKKAEKDPALSTTV